MHIRENRLGCAHAGEREKVDGRFVRPQPILETVVCRLAGMQVLSEAKAHDLLGRVRALNVELLQMDEDFDEFFGPTLDYEDEQAEVVQRKLHIVSALLRLIRGHLRKATQQRLT